MLDIGHRLSYANIIVKLYPPRAVQLYLSQCLPNSIVCLSLRGLSGFDCGSLVKITLVVYIKLAEGILQAEDVGLLELGILPG